MIKLIRGDINQLSKRKQIAAGMVNTGIGIGVIFVVDASIGASPETSVFNIVVTLATSAGFLFAYAKIMKWRANKEK